MNVAAWWMWKKSMFVPAHGRVGFFEKGPAQRARLVLERVAHLSGRQMLLLDVAQDQEERGEPLLAVDQLELVASANDDRLQVVVALAVADVVEELLDLVAAPAVTALIAGHEKLAGDLADEPWFEHHTCVRHGADTM